LAYRKTEHTLAKKADTRLRLLKAAVETFAQRALLGRTLAYALIAEPVDPRVEQNCQITAAALVGLLAMILFTV
jgi:hypothetical protein